MNTDQACRRIKSILKSMRWGGSGDTVFARDSVFVSKGPSRDYIDQLGAVSAFVWPGGGQGDREQPGLLTRTIWVTVLTMVTGDQVGERALIGANRISKTGHEGRGLLEIEAELMSVIEQLDASGQLHIGLRYASANEAELDESTGYHSWGQYGFEAWLTTAYQHQEPRAVSAAESGGTVTVSWTAPDTATNLAAYVVRRVAGTIPAGFPTDGTDVAWTSGTSVTDAPGSGTYTYSVFAAYDDEGGSVELDHSDYGAVTITF